MRNLNLARRINKISMNPPTNKIYGQVFLLIIMNWMVDSQPDMGRNLFYSVRHRQYCSFLLCSCQFILF
jgi:hypothetical protein